MVNCTEAINFQLNEEFLKYFCMLMGACLTPAFNDIFINNYWKRNIFTIDTKP